MDSAVAHWQAHLHFTRGYKSAVSTESVARGGLMLSAKLASGVGDSVLGVAETGVGCLARGRQSCGARRVEKPINMMMLDTPAKYKQMRLACVVGYSKPIGKSFIAVQTPPDLFYFIRAFLPYLKPGITVLLLVMRQ